MAIRVVAWLHCCTLVVIRCVEIVKLYKNLNVKYDERGVEDSVILDSEIRCLYPNVLTSSLKNYIEKKLS